MKEEWFKLCYLCFIPAAFILFLRSKSGNVWTQERVGVIVGGSKTNGASYSGTGILRLQCN
ncbi:MAG TPA: hypothetical protein VF553_17745 [Pyrinomonadaceae bacterium]|jgi:lipoprotein signal peptidase